MKMIFGVAALLLASSAAAQTEPDWQQVRKQAEGRLVRDAFDPQSAQITWTTGWFRGEGRSGNWGVASKKYQGWIGCASMNLRNRLGGYTGARPYSFIWTDGGELKTLDSDSQCYGRGEGRKDHYPLQAAFVDEPAAREAGGSTADELAKLAGLRDKGVLTEAEFQAQKGRLLAR